MTNVNKMLITGIAFVGVVTTTFVVLSVNPGSNSEVSSISFNSSESRAAYSVPDINKDEGILKFEDDKTTSETNSKSDQNTSSTVIDVYGQPDKGTSSSAPANPIKPDDKKPDEKKDTSSAPSVDKGKTEPSKKPDTTPNPTTPPANSGSSNNNNTNTNSTAPIQTTPPANNNKGGDPTSPFYKGGDNPFDNDTSNTQTDTNANDLENSTGVGMGEGVGF